MEATYFCEMSVDFYLTTNMQISKYLEYGEIVTNRIITYEFSR
jgi:hypothetical protein